MSYLIIYDIREVDNATRLRVCRRLRKLRALRLQQSVWESSKLAELKGLADSIGLAGGRAIVLERKPVE